MEAQPQQLEIQAPAEAIELRQQAAVLVKEAEAITIKTDYEYQRASAFLVRVAKIRNGIVAAFKDPKGKAHAAWQAIRTLETDLLAEPERAERLVKAAIGAYSREQDRKRREEEARLQQQLRRQEEDRRLAEAETLAETGHQIEAEALLEAPVLAPVVEIERPTAPGISARRAFGFRIVDPKGIYEDFKSPNETKIRQTVKALGPDAVKVVGPGLEVYEDRIVAVRPGAL